MFQVLFSNVTKVLFIVALSLLSECYVRCQVAVAFDSVVAYVSIFNPVTIIFVFFEFCSWLFIYDSNLSKLASLSLNIAIRSDIRGCIVQFDYFVQ